MNCTFCGKDQDAVDQLIAWPHCAICDECVSLCNAIIDEKKNAHIEYESWKHVFQPPMNGESS